MSRVLLGGFQKSLSIRHRQSEGGLAVKRRIIKRDTGMTGIREEYNQGTEALRVFHLQQQARRLG